ncbi:hypothetical protein PPL_11175 [Heterostelium album PN500]|uniref:RRM domain-containing protein n=1 Tax=Heterostelium pallidum (strain ATCC 26659 / Pp 5 / PN500) TaxID=670386 RepID=D3BTR5_HETP5|nr:hypothetical protein PPL_11175 [Heterostelium album PN500]EFA75101.1 hypothetical protein PPL_11175 [Heterostelium album PN500]|eukprot:XP_020427235.1 hypothetical protein PPL_11175 [Heterostelium album PN500]
MSSIDSSPSLISSPPPFYMLVNHQMHPSPNKLFVGGISWRADEAGLAKFFSTFGNVLECKIIMDRNTLKSKGYGFITFEDEESVSKVKNASTLSFMGKNMNVGDAMRKSDGFIVNNGVVPQQPQIQQQQLQQQQQQQHYSLGSINGAKASMLVPDDSVVYHTAGIPIDTGAYDNGAAALGNGYTPVYYFYYDVSGNPVIYGQQSQPYPYYAGYGMQRTAQSMPYNIPNQNWRPVYQQQHHYPTSSSPTSIPNSPNGNRQSPNRNNKSSSSASSSSSSSSTSSSQSQSPNQSPNSFINTNNNNNINHNINQKIITSSDENNNRIVNS